MCHRWKRWATNTAPATPLAAAERFDHAHGGQQPQPRYPPRRAGGGARAADTAIQVGPPRPHRVHRPSRYPESHAARFGLTDRELDVLRLLGQGKTNPEIAAALFISPRTAGVHVTHILRKLDATTRVQAATIAERAGLLASEPTRPRAT
jgi:DNA-binding CsgD family transcriptional regulator